MTTICPICESEFQKATHNQKYCKTQCKREAEKNRDRRAYTIDMAEALAKTVAPVYLELNPEEQVEFLRKEVSRLGRLYEKHKANSTEIVNAVYQAAWDSFSSVDMPKISYTEDPFASGDGDEEYAVLVLADWQLGKKTPTYDSEVCRERITMLGMKLVKITLIQRADHPVRHLRVWILGDIVEGEDIFPGQTHLIDSGLYRQVGINGPEILRDLFLFLLGHFETIHVVAVIGNHGRLNKKDFNPETNMDRLLYKIVSYMFADEPRITFSIPDGDGESNFWAVDTIGEYSTLLVHGNQFPPPSSTHTYYKKVMGWKDGAIPTPFQDVFIGHYHQTCKMTLGSTVLRISGSPESYNTYAQEVLAVMGRPSQHVQFVHPVNGVTAEYTVYLDN